MITSGHWVLFTLVIAALPSFFQLSPWVAAIALSGGLLRYGAGKLQGWYRRGVVALLLLLTVFCIYFSYDSWFSGKAILSFYIAVVFLKWSEAHTRRDYLLLIFAAVILAAVGALYWASLFGLLHMFAVIFVLIASLIAINGGVVPGKRLIPRRAFSLFLLGMPLMLVLFLSFPRIPGPLWDLGIAFGLPVKALMDRSGGQFGKMKVLQMGGIRRSDKKNTNVLVAEFEGAVPFKSRLYWRGPVFWDFDGTDWHLPANWDDRTSLLRKAIRSKKRLDYELRSKGSPVRYSLRVMANGGRWLYALDVPAMPAPEAFISDEFQLLSIRRIDDSEPKLKMLSYLDYSIGGQLSDEQRKNGLFWPEGTNPRLLALGKKFRDESGNTEEIVHAVMKILAQGEYHFEEETVLVPGFDMLDRFFFDVKKGGAQYLAGSVVMLMRAAGVPARLVSGFRGGTIVALTNFVIVKRADAHSWVEIWQDDRGWFRIEPKDIVLPPGKKSVKKDVRAEKTKIENSIRSTKEIPRDLTEKSRSVNDSSVKTQEDKERFILPSFVDIFSGLQKWVLNYNPERQVELLAGIGTENGNWLDLLMTTVVGVVFLLGLYLAVAWWSRREKTDRVSRAWKKFCAHMQKLGCSCRSNECPRDFQHRLCLELPEFAEAVVDITNRYIDIRYGLHHSTTTADLLNRQVKRFISMT